MPIHRKKKKNVLRELLRAGKLILGTPVHATWPGIIEVIGHTGVIDYVEFVGEYAPHDVYALALSIFDSHNSLKVFNPASASE